jgi:hypothetical protein
MRAKPVAGSSSEPPLQREERIEVDAETQTKIRVVSRRRGVLGIETRHYDSVFAFFREEAKQSPRAALEQFCDHLRDILEESGLPSDRTPSWVQVSNGAWEPLSTSERNRADHRHALAARYQTWAKRLEEITDPLSKDRTAGDLLEALTHLIQRKGVDDHLWHISQVLIAHRRYCIAGRINTLAANGMAGQRARAAGPATRRERALEVRRVICERTSRYWVERPILKGDASNTAAAIADEVNIALRTKGLLPSKKLGLSPKTIGDHIRAGIADYIRADRGG